MKRQKEAAQTRAQPAAIWALFWREAPAFAKGALTAWRRLPAAWQNCKAAYRPAAVRTLYLFLLLVAPLLAPLAPLLFVLAYRQEVGGALRGALGARRKKAGKGRGEK